MLGSERRSLLGGEISQRETTAKDALDQFLGKLVDAFNFQIQEQQLASAQQEQQHQHLEHEAELEQQQKTQRLEREAANGKAYVNMEPSLETEVPSPRARAPVPPMQTKSAFLLKKLSEKLSEFVLNESINQAVKEDPMELGWARSSLSSRTTTQQRSSWFDDLRDRVTLSSERGMNGEDQDDDDDLLFQTDDESSEHCSYEMMPKSSTTPLFRPST